MLSLGQAIENIQQFVQSAGFVRQQFNIENGRITTYNGTVAASAPFKANFPTEKIVVDADAFKRVWRDSAKATLEDGVICVKARKTTYYVQCLEDIRGCPDLTPGGERLTIEQRDAILLASKFASENAVHPWACGVTLHNDRAIATNNIAVISVECATHTETTLPFWAVQALRSSGPPPLLRVGSAGITFTYDDGTIIHSAPLAVQMPAKLFDVIERLENGNISIDPIKDVRDDAFLIQSKNVVIDVEEGLITCVSEHNNKAITEIDIKGLGSKITIQEPMLRLVLDNATHIGFQNAPGKLLFSSDINPKFHGAVAAMV
jgi:hypothetical protein